MAIKLGSGIHSYGYKEKIVITSWYNPLCRNFVLGNHTEDFECIVESKDGSRTKTNYKLLLKRKVDLLEEKVKLITELYNVGAAADETIISDEFLKNLAQRRGTREFQNIIFSIQKKQSEIVLAPFKQNIIVQGCAGSGKSMIMLHRLPIILYDNKKSLNRSDVSIITPSDTYIDMAKNMLADLEIQDLSMGTMVSYLLRKLKGYNTEYKSLPTKLSRRKFQKELYQYIYSSELIRDIRISLVNNTCDIIEDINLEQLPFISQVFNQRIISYSKELSSNRANKYSMVLKLKDVIKNLSALASELLTRKNRIISNIEIELKRLQDGIGKSKKELEDAIEGSVFYKNRVNSIKASITQMELLQKRKQEINEDDLYFDMLSLCSTKAEQAIEELRNLSNKPYDNLSMEEIMLIISSKDSLCSNSERIINQLRRIQDDYLVYDNLYLTTLMQLDENSKICKGLQLQSILDEKLTIERLEKINKRKKEIIDLVAADIYKKISSIVSDISQNVTYDFIPYIYLRILYEYEGKPNSARDSLIVIDEAQNIAPMELNLIRLLNPDAVFNLYGDVLQHVEDEKGINSWEQLCGEIKFNKYNMTNNYRNSKEITLYCNNRFHCNMEAINLSANDVIKLNQMSQVIDVIRNHSINNVVSKNVVLIVKDHEKALRTLGKELDNLKIILNEITEQNHGIKQGSINVIDVNDVKGIEFDICIVIGTNMTENEKYIACTRALDELIVYDV